PQFYRGHVHHPANLELFIPLCRSIGNSARDRRPGNRFGISLNDFEGVGRHNCDYGDVAAKT
ncbi:MAG: hypothetical protein WBM14_13965, partial [Terracidiphilus sp.]